MKSKNNSQIYIVEDDPLYLKALEFSLRLNFDSTIGIQAFRSGEDCLTHGGKFAPDIVVLDYTLESTGMEMNGLAVLRELKAISRETQVIMLSGHEKLEMAVDCVRSGAYDYIVKNEGAFLQITHHINLILFHVLIQKKLKRYVAWNIGLAAAFLIFILTMFMYACKHAVS
jgi:DNA-binding NtrC family response regulator